MLFANRLGIGFLPFSDYRKHPAYKFKALFVVDIMRFLKQIKWNRFD